MFLGFSFQSIGLQFTTAQKSGFLLYLNVKFVPFFARLLFGREISIATWLSALAAFVGTALIAASGSSQGGMIELNSGDLWTIAAAAASAMFIIRLERASQQVSDAAALNSACLWVVTAFAGLWTIGTSIDGGGSLSFGEVYEGIFQDIMRIFSSHGLELLYLSGVATAFANWVQTKAQREVPAERACVIYAMDPVYGAVFANLLLGETLDGIQGWVGAGLITIAAATNAFLDLPGRRAATSESVDGVLPESRKS
jgi:drug/metabolite transporter (DMT)-like permease